MVGEVFELMVTVELLFTVESTVKVFEDAKLGVQAELHVPLQSAGPPGCTAVMPNGPEVRIRFGCLNRPRMNSIQGHGNTEQKK